MKNEKLKTALLEILVALDKVDHDYLTERETEVIRIAEKTLGKDAPARFFGYLDLPDEGYTERNPNPKLVRLLLQGCDGGNGEFDKYIPPHLRKLEDLIPYLDEDGKTVIWSLIQH